MTPELRRQVDAARREMDRHQSARTVDVGAGPCISRPDLIAKYNGTAPKEIAPHRFRPTHTIGEVPTHNGKGKGGRPAAAISTECQHDRYPAKNHDSYRFRCTNCGKLANKSQWPRVQILPPSRRRAA